jgi:hypothetical protein
VDDSNLLATLKRDGIPGICPINEGYCPIWGKAKICPVTKKACCTEEKTTPHVVKKFIEAYKVGCLCADDCDTGCGCS